jgi:hypothetical protein
MSTEFSKLQYRISSAIPDFQRVDRRRHGNANAQFSFRTHHKGGGDTLCMCVCVYVCYELPACVLNQECRIYCASTSRQLEFNCRHICMCVRACARARVVWILDLQHLHTWTGEDPSKGNFPALNRNVGLSFVIDF